MSNLPLDDDDLLAALRSAHDELDPPPERLREVAIRAATWDHDLDLLVALSHDSQLADSGLRAVAAPRDLVFDSDGIAIELVVESKESDANVSVIRGEIEPVPDRVTLRSPGRPDVEVDVDEAGRFEVEVDAALAQVVASIGDREVGTGLITLFE